ncbi:MAG TPA: substrate-binding domain-containing protein [Casimicrobiaceae bacterium]|nr:substrate-binding domain-containing protein [Casimicrobiaceae bacterium]
MTLESGKIDRITGISSMAMGHVLAELGDAYERQSGQPVDIVSVGGVDAARRVDDGEAFDFVVLAAHAIEQLAAGGRVDPGSRTDLARSAVAMAVAAGATRPDVSTESAIRDAVLRARSIGYSTGPSGAHLVRLFERWGIADAIAPRIVQATPGVPVGTLVARGDVEMGFQQLSELMHLPGIDVISPLPPEVQLATVFSAAVCTASGSPAAAKALLCFLASPEADAAKRRHAMEPA